MSLYKKWGVCKNDRVKFKQSYKKYLINKFHAKDKLIFEGRLKRDFSSKMNCAIEDLMAKISNYKISQ